MTKKEMNEELRKRIIDEFELYMKLANSERGKVIKGPNGGILLYSSNPWIEDMREKYMNTAK